MNVSLKNRSDIPLRDYRFGGTMGRNIRNRQEMRALHTNTVKFRFDRVNLASDPRHGRYPLLYCCLSRLSFSPVKVRLRPTFDTLRIGSNWVNLEDFDDKLDLVDHNPDLRMVVSTIQVLQPQKQPKQPI